MVRLGALVGAERGRLFPWVPVCMGLGIALWLGWAGEPGAAAYGGAFALALVGFGAWRSGGLLVMPLGAAVLAVAIGFLSIGARSDRVAGPVLGFRYYGPLEGRVVDIDRSQSDRLRLTLDRVVLERVAPARTPLRVRVSLHGDQRHVDPVPGMRVMMTAHLSPPDGPVEPGGFDFQRMAWFRSLGAVGYTRTPVLAQAPPGRADARVTRMRMAISASVQDALPGEPGAFAAAILTGDRSGIGQATVQALRDSNLAHLLAISGLHMGLLTGFVFVAIRVGLALVPPLALRVPGKKVAAVVALAAAAFYLALSGGNVATERAFVMVAVMLGAVLLDRRAISLRSVALAAVAILLMQPESMAEPGFQMSFAATAALVAGFAVLRDRGTLRRLPGWAQPVAMLVISSALAGFATAPIAAMHFNRYSDFGLLANLAAVPLMGTVVIPAAVVAAVLSPLGWQAPALWAMEQGTRWILAVAHEVSGWPGAVTLVAEPGGHVLPLVVGGGLALILLRGPVRLVGAVPLVAALAFWGGGGRPVLLIAGDGGLVGLMGPQGRALSAPRGNGFAAEVWMENDGDRVGQEAASARPGFAGSKGDRRFALGGVAGAVLTGKGAAARLESVCASVRLVVLADQAGPSPPGCLVIDRNLLARTGPISATPATGGGLRFAVTRPVAPRRWTGATRAREDGAGTDSGQILAMLQDRGRRLAKGAPAARSAGPSRPTTEPVRDTALVPSGGGAKSAPHGTDKTRHVRTGAGSPARIAAN